MINKGKVIGFEDGKDVGFEDGINDVKTEISKNMLKENININTISKAAVLSIENIQSIK